MKSPIVILAYNRPKHLHDMLEKLKSILDKDNSKRDVYLFIDGPKNNDDIGNSESVLRVANDFLNKNVITHIIVSEKNKGLSESVINAVSYVLKEHESIIVLEDDILVSDDFLPFIDSCLELYKDRSDICSVTGFSYKDIPSSKLYPILCNRAMSWSWATWKNKWFDVNFDAEFYRANRESLLTDVSNQNIGADIKKMLDGYLAKKIDSWYVRWTLYNYYLKRLTIYPSIGLISNIGFDGSGVNCSISQGKTYKNKGIKNVISMDCSSLSKDKFFEKALVSSFNPSLLVRIYRKLF
ncbi:hypothetical protein CGT77_13085 [Vibrio cholerae]|uniref:glycosyltransferase family A protein n=1 Tax=Vibrio cholerae TaxID=666 RepID=UPI0006E70A27|nr:glycosyltransferase family A protein [Vibrio cholerae]EJL6615622.1 glycosyltransferase [Vibrio cholerae]KQA49453.1 hypothetical protein XV77_11790 [Vibrio cholerae]PAS07950.1 hypothetical protein CGT77_13085 [Vibrio cholerae]PAS15294.1 hypothetical protein CGT75_14600 [Vibrio cholerae]